MLVIKTLGCLPSLQLQPTGTTSAEQAEIRQLLAEENVEVLTEEDRDRLTQLDSLTGVPRGDDVLLFALPMCAPYQVCLGPRLPRWAQLRHQISTKKLGLELPQAGVKSAFAVASWQMNSVHCHQRLIILRAAVLLPVRGGQKSPTLTRHQSLNIKNGTVLLQALQGYKYRLKLTPGSQRKGKAARQVG